MSNPSEKPSLRKRRDSDGLYVIVQSSGKQYGPYDHIYYLEETDPAGTPYFAVRRGEYCYLVHGNKEYGPYQTVHEPKFIGGTVCSLAMNVTGEETLYYLIHGERTYGPFDNADWGSLAERDGSPSFIFYEDAKAYRFEVVVSRVPVLD